MNAIQRKLRRQSRIESFLPSPPLQPLPPIAHTASPFFPPDTEDFSDFSEIPHLSLDEPPRSSSAPPSPTSSNSYEDWEDQMELELQRIKNLFLKHQYKDCAAQCAQLLPSQPDTESTHKAYVHFYAALSYEEIARSQHHQSPHVLSNIELAAQYYHAASKALPAPIIPERRKPMISQTALRMTVIDFAVNLRDDISESSAYSSPYSSHRNSLSSDTHSEYSTSTAPSSVPPTSPVETKKLSKEDDDWFVAMDEVTWDDMETSSRKPSPLRIRKEEVQHSPDTSWLSLSDSEDDSEDEDEAELLLQGLCEPRDLRQPRNLQLSNKRRVQLFNENLTAFYGMLENHVESLSRLKESVTKMQAREHQKLSKEERTKERITMGRERNWERKRFDPKRYQDLCDQALAWI